MGDRTGDSRTNRHDFLVFLPTAGGRSLRRPGQGAVRLLRFGPSGDSARPLRLKKHLGPEGTFRPVKTVLRMP